MFKNLTIYRIGADWKADLAKALKQAEGKQFVECGPTQVKSVGWVPPRQENGALIELVAGQWIMKAAIEKKSVPASVVRKKLDEKLKEIEKATGRRPRGKAAKELKEEIVMELLPRAFPKHDEVVVWIDHKKRLVAIDVGSQAKGDEIGTLLVDTLDGFGISPLQTNMSASTSMSIWLREREAPAGFTIDRECQLKATDEGKATVTYAKHGLDTDEVRLHLEQGKAPTKLAMTWDERVSFVLVETGAIKKLSFDDVVFEKTTDEKDDAFDANAAITTGELSKLIPDLLDALGGELAAEDAQEAAAA